MYEIQFLMATVSCFMFIKILFKNDPLKDIGAATKINKNFKDCFIVVFPNHSELHNKKLIFPISNLEEFYKLNPKLKGKIKEVKKDYPIEIKKTKKEPVKTVCVKEKVREEINSKFQNK